MRRRARTSEVFLPRKNRVVRRKREKKAKEEEQ